MKTLFTEEQRQSLREAGEAVRAQKYAKDVADAMLRLRGYRGKKAPREVVDDVFHTLAKADRVYTRLFASNVKPEKAAEMIQNMVWDGKLK